MKRTLYDRLRYPTDDEVADAIRAIPQHQSGWTFVSNGAASSSNTNNVSVTINTTGADFLALVINDLQSVAISTPTDLVGGLSNSWTKVQSYIGLNGRVTIWYCQNPAHVGASHAFSYAIAVGYPGITAFAFSGSLTSPLDQQNGSSGNFTTSSSSPGSITPTQANELLICGIVMDSNDTGLTIPTSFAGPTFGPRNGNSFGADAGYLIQGAAAPINPSWTWSGGSQYSGVAIASFLPFSISSPTLTSLSPNSVSIGSGSTLVTLTGTGFVSGCVVNAAALGNLTTTFVNSTMVTVTLTTAQLATIYLASGNHTNFKVTNADTGVTGNQVFTVTSGGSSGFAGAIGFRSGGRM